MCGDGDLDDGGDSQMSCPTTPQGSCGTQSPFSMSVSDGQQPPATELTSGGFGGYPGSRSSARKRQSFKLHEIPEEGKTRLDTRGAVSVRVRSSGDKKESASAPRRGSVPSYASVTQADTKTHFSFDVTAKSPQDFASTLSYDTAPSSPFDVSSEPTYDVTPNVTPRSAFDVKVELRNPTDVKEASAGSGHVRGSNENGVHERESERL